MTENCSCKRTATRKQDENVTLPVSLLTGLVGTFEHMLLIQQEQTKRCKMWVAAFLLVAFSTLGFALYVWETGEFEFTDEVSTTTTETVTKENVVEQDSNSGTITQGDISFGGK